MIARSDEFIDAAERLLWQLVAAGISRQYAHGCVIRYLDALSDRTDDGWARFYRELSLRFYEAALTRERLPAQAAAVLRIIDDDFGQRIVEPEMRKRISRAIVEREHGEASLPS